MATFRRFEDIQAWQLGRELNREVYRLTSGGGFARDFGLRDQIRRASVSVTSNVAEGYGRRSARDFARFLTMASGSTAEVQSQLYLALDLGYLSRDDFDATLALARRIAGALVNLTAYLRSTSTVREPAEEYVAKTTDEPSDNQPPGSDHEFPGSEPRTLNREP